MALIALDARKYFDFGIGTYIQCLTQGLSSLQSRHDFLLIVSDKDEHAIRLQSPWRTLAVSYGKYSVSEFVLLGRHATSVGADLFHSPHYTLPLGLKGRSIVSIHDLIPLKIPSLFTPVQRLYASAMMKHSIRAAKRVLVESVSTKQDLQSEFKIAEDSIAVIPLGVGSEFTRVSGRRVNEFRKKFRLEREILLFVGNTKGHKGLSLLLRAFAELIRRHPDLDLVVIGGVLEGPKVLGLLSELRLEAKVRSLGRVSREDLVAAYCAATLFVLPSLYEGFGLPVLEAMACGTPVVCSDAGSLPEVAGNAARIVKTGDAGALTEEIDMLLHDRALRQRMSRKGKKRASEFSWETTAQRTLQVYEEVLSE